MKKSNQLALGALGIGLLFLVLTADSDAPSQSADPKAPDEPPPPKPEEAPPGVAAPEKPKRDPLPDFELTQGNIVLAILEYLEHEWPEKMQSMIIKANSRKTDDMLAYILACLKRFPIYLREEKLWLNVEEKVHKKDRDERRDIIAEGRDREAKLEAVMNVVPVVGPLLAAAMNIGFGALYDWLEKDGQGRVAEDQILSTYEGVGLLKGVSFDVGPEVPNLNREDQIKRSEIRNRWWQEKDNNESFAQLPVVPRKKAFRFAPTYSDFVSAVESIRGAR